MSAISKLENKQIVVIGASGFVGSSVCEEFRKNAISITAVVRNKDSVCKIKQIYFCDFEKDSENQIEENLHLAFNNAQIVFHIAGQAHINSELSCLQRVNTYSTQKIIEIAVANKVKRLIYFSSSLVAACEQNKEDLTDYGQSKWEAEKLLNAASERGEIEIVILRPVNVYGINMKGNILGMISLIKKRRLPPLPKLNNKISLIGIGDLVSIALKAASNGSVIGKTYTVTDGVEYEINKIEAIIYRCLMRKQASWRTPRVIFYIAACLINSLSMAVSLIRRSKKSSSIGIRTYKNLVNDNIFDNKMLRDDFNFKAQQCLYTELPNIINQLQKNK